MYSNMPKPTLLVLVVRVAWFVLFVRWVGAPSPVIGQMIDSMLTVNTATEMERGAPRRPSRKYQNERKNQCRYLFAVSSAIKRTSL